MSTNSWRERHRDRFNELWRNWYRKNSARKYAWEVRHRREIRAWWKAFKSTKRCETCGESAPECLHFHHEDPAKKDFNIANAVSNGWSRDRIMAEVAKCRPLCANCHLKLHWEERRRKWSG